MLEYRFHYQTKMRQLTSFLLVAMFALAGCLPAAGAGQFDPGLPTGTASPATPLATIVWFPPTSTWTPFPTPQATATLEGLPGLGAEIFSDDFSGPEAWPGAKTEGDGGNNAIINRNRLTLAVNVPPVYLFSLHNKLQLTSFYAEVNVSVNRCEGSDAYGMLFRAAGNVDSYRYVLACDGRVRAERLQSSKVNVLQDWLPSGDVPPGAPGQVKLGVWVSGVELRFFLNGHYQFSVIDPVFHNGTLGLFVDAASPGGMNVSFSNLVVRDVSYVSPTPTTTPTKTATPSRTPRP
jgi:hypothetical protein